MSHKGTSGIKKVKGISVLVVIKPQNKNDCDYCISDWKRFYNAGIHICMLSILLWLIRFCIRRKVLQVHLFQLCSIPEKYGPQGIRGSEYMHNIFGSI